MVTPTGLCECVCLNQKRMGTGSRQNIALPIAALSIARLGRRKVQIRDHGVKFWPASLQVAQARNIIRLVRSNNTQSGAAHRSRSLSVSSGHDLAGGTSIALYETPAS